MRLSLGFLLLFLVLGCVCGHREQRCQAPAITGHRQRLSVCGDADTEVSGDREEHPSAGTAHAEPSVWDGKLQSLTSSLRRG